MEGVSAAEVRNGAKDIQGIQWYRRTNITREEVRQRKLRNNLRNRGRNIPQSGETPDKVIQTYILITF